MIELKNLEDAIEKKLETEIMIEAAKRKLTAMEKNKINEIEEDLRIKTVIRS